MHSCTNVPECRTPPKPDVRSDHFLGRGILRLDAGLLRTPPLFVVAVPVDRRFQTTAEIS